jgi:hypothetical protein
MLVSVHPTVLEPLKLPRFLDRLCKTGLENRDAFTCLEEEFSFNCLTIVSGVKAWP